MTELRIVSWNIDARGHGLEERIERLDHFGADVLLLQEVPRRVASRLEDAPGFAWTELATLHSEPDGGPSTRIGTAILGTSRVRLVGAGQTPKARFLEAGMNAGLSEAEVRDRTGWFHRNLYADVEVDGLPLRVASLHARPATGGAPGRPPLGYARQLFHRVCAAWISEQTGPMVFGVDANSPRIDHPDPDRWEPGVAGDATLIGPRTAHHLRDALYRWLEDHPAEAERIRSEHPNGPLATSYVTSGGRRCRYDHLFVTDDITVGSIDYRAPRADGSDHGAVVADLILPEPRA